MHPLTPLPPTGLYCIEVPKDASGFLVDYEEKINTNQEIFSYLKKDNSYHNFILPEGNWQILGTVTKEEVSFDTAPYLGRNNEEDNDGKCYFNFGIDSRYDLTPIEWRLYTSSHKLILKNLAKLSPTLVIEIHKLPTQTA